MTRLHERIETTLGLEETFAYVADFANSQEWDPGVDSAERIDDGPLDVGARFRLGVHLAGRVAPMEYRITAFEPPNRVVLQGEGSNVTAIDDIRFERDGDATRIDYTADIRLGGLLRFVQPLLGGAFRSLARNAVEGMRSTLERRAMSGDDPSPDHDPTTSP